MVSWKRAAGFGFASWLIPFAISFAVFPLKQSNAPLFGTLMGLIVLLTAGGLLTAYFRGQPVTLRAAVLVGCLWFVMNLMFDYPMFAYGPMKMSPGHYYSEIGLVYLSFPAFAFWAARLVKA